MCVFTCMQTFIQMFQYCGPFFVGVLLLFLSNVIQRLMSHEATDNEVTCLKRQMLWNTNGRALLCFDESRWRKDETKTAASPRCFNSFLKPPPPSLHTQHSPVTMCVIRGAPRDVRTHEAAVSQTGSSPAKITDTPSQPIQRDGVQVELHVQHKEHS